MRFPRKRCRRLVRPGPSGRSLRVESLEARRLLVGSGTINLGEVRFEENSALFDVTLEYRPLAAESLSVISLDVESSSANLSDAGTDYAAFSFLPASPLLDDWKQISSFDDAGGSAVVFDNLFTGLLPAGDYDLGTLSVGLESLGLSPAHDFTVSIASGGTLIGLRGRSFALRFEPLEFGTGVRQHQPTVLSAPNRVDEGSPFVLTVETHVHLGGVLHVDWGDGRQEVFSVEDNQPVRELVHTYADDTDPLSIVVSHRTQSGTVDRTLSVVVTDVSPTISLSAPSRVEAGSGFTVVLSSVSDPGADTVSRYVIAWGDGQLVTYSSVAFPPDGRLRHRYASADISPTIRVDLQNEDGLHQSAGVFEVTVDPPLPFDIDGDGLVTPADVLLVINELNRNGTRRVAGGDVRFDANRDGWITSGDALQVINVINAANAAGEGVSLSAEHYLRKRAERLEFGL